MSSHHTTDVIRGATRDPFPNQTEDCVWVWKLDFPPRTRPGSQRPGAGTLLPVRSRSPANAMLSNRTGLRSDSEMTRWSHDRPRVRREPYTSRDRRSPLHLLPHRASGSPRGREEVRATDRSGGRCDSGHRTSGHGDSGPGGEGAVVQGDRGLWGLGRGPRLEEMLGDRRQGGDYDGGRHSRNVCLRGQIRSRWGTRRLFGDRA